MLTGQLLVTNEELRETSRNNGIGNEVCELNPVLMQELYKLRHDNKELQSKLSQTSVDALNELTKENEDLKYMNQSLQTKWSETKDALAAANNHIQNLFAEIAFLKKEIADLNQCKAQLESKNEDCLNQIKSLTTTKENLEKQILMASADLEEEVMKRRKVERVKKQHETENQRLKLLQATTGGEAVVTNADYEAAAKEIRSMQEQLDSANQEISRLKSVLDSNGCKDAISLASGSDGSSTRTLLKPHRSSTAMGHNALSSHHHGSQVNSYLEQVELNDRRIEQLEREKREILSRALEDNKEKVELTQKLMVMDKECSNLRTELRKITLDKERVERKLNLNGLEDVEKGSSHSGSILTASVDKENILVTKKRKLNATLEI